MSTVAFPIRYITESNEHKLVARCALRRCGKRAVGAVDIHNALRLGSGIPEPELLTILMCAKHEDEWAKGYLHLGDGQRLRDLCDIPVEHVDADSR